MGNIIETTDLCKTIRNRLILRDISIQIPENGVYGLLGPNGAGKSTFLKILIGIMRPTQGSVLFRGRAWSRADLSEIGALIEGAPLYDNLTAEENLRVRTALLGIPATRIEGVLSRVGLAGVGNKRAGAFSVGMRQRLGIALALVSEPSLLILDEPTNGLDPVGIEDMREMITSFPAAGITVILASHLLDEVKRTADHIGIINKGVLSFQGKLSDDMDLRALFMDVIKGEGVGA